MNNTKEVVLDRYTSIEFSENMEEFFVTNTLNQVGIIDLDGATKIEPIYESILVLDKKEDLYIVKQSQKYGVVKGKNINVIYPEYDNIGFESNNITNTSNNKSLILDTLIPVCKGGKWGAYDKKGNFILKLEYDAFGYDLNSIEIDGVREGVQPVLAIERCNGVVVKKDNKYGLISMNGKVLVKAAVDAIYSINAEDEDSMYFMLYNGEKSNIIEKLITAGLIEDTNNEELEYPSTNIYNELLINNVIKNLITNTQ